MKEKLSRIRSPWWRRLITLLINASIFFGKYTHSRPRARIHWVGHANRPRRPERVFLALLWVVFILAAMIVLEQHEFLVWSAAWGSLFAIGVNSYMIYRLIPRTKSY